MTEAEFYELLRRSWTASGWPWWTAPYDLNVFGIRAASSRPDRWDDVIGIAYNDGKANHVERFVATTDPGGAYLLTPMTALGTIIVEEGYHKGLWATGKHQGKYDALVQVGPLDYRRDNDRDEVLDQDGVLVQDAMWNGINLHHGYGNAIVGKNSAGCQVVRFQQALLRILALVELQRQHGHGSKVSYGLAEVRRHPELEPLLLLGA